MKTRACLMIAAAAPLLGSPAGTANGAPPASACQDPNAFSRYMLVTADEYPGRQPNLIVTGAYQTHMRTGEVTLVPAATSPSGDPKMIVRGK